MNAIYKKAEKRWPIAAAFAIVSLMFALNMEVGFVGVVAMLAVGSAFGVLIDVSRRHESNQ